MNSALRKEMGERTLLGIALDVHTTTTGSMERSYKKQQADIDFLKRVVREWEPSLLPAYEEFDSAVLGVVLAALGEVR